MVIDAGWRAWELTQMGQDLRRDGLELQRRDSTSQAVLEFVHLVLASGAFDGKARVFRQRPIP
jgi:hypothetical protein